MMMRKSLMMAAQRLCDVALKLKKTKRRQKRNFYKGPSYVCVALGSKNPPVMSLFVPLIEAFQGLSIMNYAHHRS